MKRHFRFFTQRVLPLVYDDSLSYYEILCKMQNGLISLEEDIDNNLLTWIEEAIPELISEATYDDATGTLSFVLVTDEIHDQITNEPIKRISVNGISRPVMDEIARKWSGESWLFNKKICMYGDSTLVVAETYATKIRDAGICQSVTIRGVSGMTLTNYGYQQIRDAEDLNTFDYVFVCYGINDWSGIAKLSWADAVKATAERIINAGSEPVFVFPWMVYIPTMASNGFINNKGCDMAGFVDAAIDVCKQLKIKYFNLCQLSDVNESNYATRLTRSSNGYYLHEGEALGEYITKAILNGNYNTGTCYGDRFREPFRLLIPSNWGYKGFSDTQTLITAVPVRYRKGNALTISPNALCEFLPITSGPLCRVQGFAQHEVDNGYVDISYIDLYHTDLGAQNICRVQSGSDFDFVFSPGTDGSAFKLCAQASTGGFCLLMDLRITSSIGNGRLSGSTPTVPAKSMTINSETATLAVGGYMDVRGDHIRLLPFAIRAAADMAQGATVIIGNVGFYPQHPIYGTCHIGANNQLYRVRPTGEVDLYVLGAAVPENTYIMFDGVDITPTPFLYS